MATATYELIDSTVLTSAVSSFTFSGIDQSYRDLQLVISGTTSGVYYTYFRANNSATTYYSVSAGGTGSATKSRTNSTSSGYFLGGFDFYASTSGCKVLTTVSIMDYSATDKFTPILARTNIIGGTNPGTAMWAGRNSITAAVTSLEILGLSIDHTKPNQISLYGISA